MRPRVDFVILSHNRIDTAITAIESALAQDGVDGHVYVIDQNSSAAAFERLRSFCAGQPGVTLHRNARNNGVAKGRNQGIAMGSAPYIIGVDDDASMVGADEAVKALAVMQADDSIGAVGFNMIDSVTREPPPTMVDLKANTAQGRPVTLFLGGG